MSISFYELLLFGVCAYLSEILTHKLSVILKKLSALLGTNLAARSSVVRCTLKFTFGLSYAKSMTDEEKCIYEFLRRV